jgi:L-lactate dehydrogenase complex protein LldG
MNSREFILASVRRNEPPDTELPAIPEFGPPVPDPLATFTEALARMGGTVTQEQLFPQARVVCSAAPEVRGTRALVRDSDPRELQDVDVAVVRAAFGVAETGSVWLSESEFGVNALGFLAQHLVVLLDPSAIVRNLHDAYRHPRFRTARYAVLMTGPSATADIEGVLVRGAQGIRSLTVIPFA